MTEHVSALGLIGTFVVDESAQEDPPAQIDKLTATSAMTGKACRVCLLAELSPSVRQIVGHNRLRQRILYLRIWIGDARGSWRPA